MVAFTRYTLIVLMLVTIFAAIGFSTHSRYDAVLAASFVLMLLAFQSMAKVMSPAFVRSDWDYKHFQRAKVRRTLVQEEADRASPTKKSFLGRDIQQSLAKSQGMEGRGLLKSLLSLARPAAEVVLLESTKLAWADHRFEEVLTHSERAAAVKGAKPEDIEAAKKDDDENPFDITPRKGIESWAGGSYLSPAKPKSPVLLGSVPTAAAAAAATSTTVAAASATMSVPVDLPEPAVDLSA